MASEFVSAITNSLHEVPYGIRWLCNTIVCLVKVRIHTLDKNKEASVCNNCSNFNNLFHFLVGEISGFWHKYHFPYWWIFSPAILKSSNSHTSWYDPIIIYLKVLKLCSFMEMVEVLEQSNMIIKWLYTYPPFWLFSTAFMLVSKPPSQCARRNLTLVSYLNWKLINK